MGWKPDKLLMVPTNWRLLLFEYILYAEIVKTEHISVLDHGGAMDSSVCVLPQKSNPCLDKL